VIDMTGLRIQDACRGLNLFSSAHGKEREEIISDITKLGEILKAELLLNNFDQDKTIQSLLAAALKVEYGMDGTDVLVEEKLRLQSEEPDKVSLMKIHASKGLEARCVILAAPDARGMEKVDTLVDCEVARCLE
jgi:ATP-dependent exoDNAse (exonuclease V) beta subunit